MTLYRKLTDQEIDLLLSQNCKCEDWNLIHVINDFSPENIINTTFSGSIILGTFKNKISFPGGVKKQSGIYNAVIHNCKIGNDTLINQVKNYISNYEIGNNVIIENIERITVEGKSCFGNGIKINVLDETGGRQILIYDQLSAHNAYIQALYRHRPKLIRAIEKMITDYSSKKCAQIGQIKNFAQIINSKQITNVFIGEYSNIQGINRLNNGSINSNKEAPIKIGPGVIADNFIISSGSEVSDSTIINNCFVGQGCILSKHYSAIDSVFFSNCQGFNGEACSIFAGPFTVTHHKSTLLIAGMFSFLNAGSGSNQSNHMYKLGPIHHGIVSRGSKTTSDSYLLWPAKIGPFTLVMGRHYQNTDTSDMPFSYLIENNDKSWLVPAFNIRSVGTIRDAMKWPKRDIRTDSNLLDHVNYNLLSPYTIQKMINGQNILKKLKKESIDSKNSVQWETTFIKKKSLDRGIKLYEIGIVKFLGNSVISKIMNCKKLETLDDVRNCLLPETNLGTGNWIDLAGLIAPKKEIDSLIQKIEEGKINSLVKLENTLKNLHENYYKLEWSWASNLLEKRLQKSISEITIDDLINIIHSWIKSVVELDQMLYQDAKKEYALSAMTGFGSDGDFETKKQEFEEVRGTFEKNAFVTEILNHISRKTDLGNRTIKLLENNKTDY